MSASHIPNLNTLRRGSGRGLRRRGGAPTGPSDENNGAHGSGGGTGKDKVVQGTDNDASVSRLSAVNLGYIEDAFARALTPPMLEARRFPIINRGTYVRTTAIDRLVDAFLDGEGKRQIISLGAGSDTRIFRLLSSSSGREHLSHRLVYHEIDFAVNTTAKINAIRSTPVLQRVLGMDTPKADGVIISETGDALHSSGYHIHPLDLRSLSTSGGSSREQGKEKEKTPHLKEVDPSLPTLLISECCLVYLSPAEADGVVEYFTKSLFPDQRRPLGLILYEPIQPNDPFGRTMVSNLATRGIHLQTLHKYATLELQRDRLREYGFDRQGVADVEFLWEKWVGEEEKERVSRLEMLDEMEEWQLLARHYCVGWGWRNGFEGWGEIEAQVQAPS